MAEDDHQQASGTGYWPIPIFLSVMAIAAIIVFNQKQTRQDELSQALDAGLAPIIQVTQESGVIYKHPALDANMSYTSIRNTTDFSPELDAELKALGIDPEGWSCVKIKSNLSASVAILEAGNPSYFEPAPWLFVPGGWSRKHRGRTPEQIYMWETLKDEYHFVNATDRFCVRPGGER